MTRISEVGMTPPNNRRPHVVPVETQRKRTGKRRVHRKFQRHMWEQARQTRRGYTYLIRTRGRAGNRGRQDGDQRKTSRSRGNRQRSVVHRTGEVTVHGRSNHAALKTSRSRSNRQRSVVHRTGEVTVHGRSNHTVHHHRIWEARVAKDTTQTRDSGNHHLREAVVAVYLPGRDRRPMEATAAGPKLEVCGKASAQSGSKIKPNLGKRRRSSTS